MGTRGEDESTSTDAAAAVAGDRGEETSGSEAGPSGRNTLLVEKHKAYIKSLDNVRQKLS